LHKGFWTAFPRPADIVFFEEKGQGMALSVPSANDPIWSDIVSGKRKFQFDFVAAKILLGHLNVKVRHRNEPSVVQEGARELHDVFARNVQMPSVQRDLAKILN
jgi:hypothetical protein